MSHTNTRRTLDDIIRFTSAVGEGAIFTGNIATPDNVVVRGTLIGDSNVEGIIVVELTGKWLGNLVANTLIINGRVEGNITAFCKIEVQKSATIIGNITSPKIAIESGAVHEGLINMEEKPHIIAFNEKRKK
ncbi:hypothetical protein MNBD_GAMMA22-2593 [hydrothermal vent metagenome]|uniref:Integral membrane protein CcmA involved in cell shape determination n=1 Tax=hydrothermal vent metagenome TaxID=652676 RepID=A0A3B1A8A2_9ZZZZ